jgi:predicted extracellular nuclease
MPRLRKPLVLLATLAVPTPSVAAADLFISEYVEGSGLNKAIEIYNPTGAAVDLSDYELRVYLAGAASPSHSVTLSGAVEDAAQPWVR